MIQHQISNSLGNYNYNAYIYKTALWPPHFHGNYELIYVFSGTAEVSVNGVSDTLHPGELLFIPPHSVHSLTVDEGETWVGVFSEDFISAYAQNNKYARYSKFRCSEDVEDTLKKFLFFEGTPERYLCISCLYMVCSECLKNAVCHTSEQNSNFVYSVVTYIYANLNTDITMKGIADSLNYEYHYFSALFNKYFSIHFKGFINMFRFEKACSLLSDSANTVTYVAECCGFGSIRNFNRVFKKFCGCTPMEYRKKQLKK